MTIKDVITELRRKKPSATPIDYFAAVVASYFADITLDFTNETNVKAIETAIRAEDPVLADQLATLSLSYKQNVFLTEQIKKLFSPFPAPLTYNEYLAFPGEQQRALKIREETIRRINKILLAYLLAIQQYGASEKDLADSYIMNYNREKFRADLVALKALTERPEEDTASEDIFNQEATALEQIYHPQSFAPLFIALWKKISAIESSINQTLQELDDQLKAIDTAKLKSQEALSLALIPIKQKIYQAIGTLALMLAQHDSGLPKEVIHFLLADSQKGLIKHCEDRVQQHIDDELFYRTYHEENHKDHIINRLTMRHVLGDSILLKPMGLNPHDSRLASHIIGALAKTNDRGIGRSLFKGKTLLSEMEMGSDLYQLATQALGPCDGSPLPLDFQALEELEQLYQVGSKAHSKATGKKFNESCVREAISANPHKSLIWTSLITLSPNAPWNKKYDAYLKLAAEYQPPGGILRNRVRLYGELEVNTFRCIVSAQYLLNENRDKLSSTEMHTKQQALEQQLVHLTHNALLSGLPPEDKKHMLGELQNLLNVVKPKKNTGRTKPNIYTFLYNDVTAFLAYLEENHIDDTFQIEKNENYYRLTPITDEEVERYADCERGAISVAKMKLNTVEAMLDYAIAVAHEPDLETVNRSLQYFTKATLALQETDILSNYLANAKSLLEKMKENLKFILRKEYHPDELAKLYFEMEKLATAIAKKEQVEQHSRSETVNQPAEATAPIDDIIREEPAVSSATATPSEALKPITPPITAPAPTFFASRPQTPIEPSSYMERIRQQLQEWHQKNAELIYAISPSFQQYWAQHPDLTDEEISMMLTGKSPAEQQELHAGLRQLLYFYERGILIVPDTSTVFKLTALKNCMHGELQAAVERDLAEAKKRQEKITPSTTDPILANFQELRMIFSKLIQHLKQQNINLPEFYKIAEEIESEFDGSIYSKHYLPTVDFFRRGTGTLAENIEQARLCLAKIAHFIYEENEPKIKIKLLKSAFADQEIIESIERNSSIEKLTPLDSQQKQHIKEELDKFIRSRANITIDKTDNHISGFTLTFRSRHFRNSLLTHKKVMSAITLRDSLDSHSAETLYNEVTRLLAQNETDEKNKSCHVPFTKSGFGLALNHILQMLPQSKAAQAPSKRSMSK